MARSLSLTVSERAILAIARCDQHRAVLQSLVAKENSDVQIMKQTEQPTIFATFVGTPLVRRSLYALGLVTLVTIVYWPTLDNGFVWDDTENLEANAALRSLGGLFDIWFKPGALPQYWPLTQSSFWVEYHLWGLDPRGYHLVNLILHATVVLLIWRVLFQLSVPGAWLGAAIFAVHPICVESVAWVTERKNLLSCVLGLGALLAYLQFSPPDETSGSGVDLRPSARRTRYYFLALTLYAAALLAKTAVVALPAVLLVILWWKRSRLKWREAGPLVPFFAVGLALSWMTIWVENDWFSGLEWNPPLVDRVLIAGRALWFYVGKLLWPYPIVFVYPHWVIDSRVGWQYMYPVAAVLAIFSLWLARGRIGRGPFAAVAIFAGVLAPVLGFFYFGNVRFAFVADHLQYQASIAMIALAAAGVVMIADRFPARTRQLTPLVSAALLLPLVVLAHQKTPAYKDIVALSQDVFALDPHSSFAANNLGVHAMSQGNYDEGIVYLRDAVRLLPDEPMHHCNLGVALSKRGHLDEAVVEFNRALACPSGPRDKAWALKQLAAVQMQLRRFEQALLYLNQAIALHPKLAEAYVDRARVEGMINNFPAALRDLEQALRLSPGAPDALLLRAVLRAKSGSVEPALADLKSLLASQPDNPEVLHQIAEVHLTAHQFPQAVLAYDQLIKINPLDVAAYRGRADARLGLGGQLQAIADFEAALQLEPQNYEVLNNLAWLLATSADDKVRDGQRADALAKLACAGTNYLRANFLSTLAAANAETGDFQTATLWSLRAVQLGGEELRPQLTAELRSYEDHKPWRVPVPTDEAATAPLESRP